MLKMLIVTYILVAGGEQKVEIMVTSDASCHELTQELGKRVAQGLEANAKQNALVRSFKTECIQMFGE